MTLIVSFSNFEAQGTPVKISIILAYMSLLLSLWVVISDFFPSKISKAIKNYKEYKEVYNSKLEVLRDVKDYIKVISYKLFIINNEINNPKLSILTTVKDMDGSKSFLEKELERNTKIYDEQLIKCNQDYNEIKKLNIPIDEPYVRLEKNRSKLDLRIEERSVKYIKDCI